MFDFFFKNYVGDLGRVKVDMHNHILPGLDDGSSCIEESREMSKQLANWGIEQAIYTPHVYADLYPNSPSSIQPAFERLLQDTEHSQAFSKHSFAAEYMLDDSFRELLKKEEPLLCLKDNLILVEFPLNFENIDTDTILFDLFIAGYQPVIAHPERYRYLHHLTASYQRLKDMGCLLQLNFLSLGGFYGPDINAQAEKLLSKGLIDLVSTDIHKAKQLAAVEQVLRSKAWKKFEKYDFTNAIFIA
jgi:protein-tyrosine phosphatase